MNNIFGNQLSNEINRNYLSYLINKKSQIKSNKRAVDILNYCLKNDMRLVILSNIDGIPKLFDIQTDSEDINSIIETFEIHQNEDSILFIGETLKDMSIAFQNKFVPIMLSKETNNLQILQNINLVNPIRLINDQTDFYELFEKSQNCGKKKEKRL